jgi:hypothetical protein
LVCGPFCAMVGNLRLLVKFLLHVHDWRIVVALLGVFILRAKATIWER